MSVDLGVTPNHIRPTFPRDRRFVHPRWMIIVMPRLRSGFNVPNDRFHMLPKRGART